MHVSWREAGAFQVRSHIDRERTTHTLVVEETLLKEFDRNSQISLRASGRVFGLHHSSVGHALHENTLHPYHFQRVQTLCVDDYIKQAAFATARLTSDFLLLIFFSDKSSFKQDSVRILHVWAHENQMCTRVHAHQQRFALNVWAGTVGDKLTYYLNASTGITVAFFFFFFFFF